MKTFAFIRKVNHRYDADFHYCGYVGISNDVKIPDSWQGAASFDDDNALDNKVKVHGGITYDEYTSEWMENDIKPITDMPKDWHECRIVGFDLNHYSDYKTGVHSNLDYCISETKSLLEQINNLIKEE